MAQSKRKVAACGVVPVIACEVKKPATSIPITYTIWLVHQPTHVQETILGVDRATELRAKFAELQSIAGGMMTGGLLEKASFERFQLQADPKTSLDDPHSFVKSPVTPPDRGAHSNGRKPGDCYLCGRDRTDTVHVSASRPPA